MLKLCENGSNIDYLYEISSVLRKATETEISGLTFWLRFGFLKTETEPKFGFRTSLLTTFQRLANVKPSCSHSMAKSTSPENIGSQSVHFFRQQNMLQTYLTVQFLSHLNSILCSMHLCQLRHNIRINFKLDTKHWTLLQI